MKELDKKVITNLNIVKKFHKAPLVEALKKVENPGTGWYHLYTFDATCADPVLYIACEEEEIVLLLIDIGGFRGKELSTEALLSIRQIFYFFKEKKRDMIVRFSYDTEGKGMEKEPESGRIVLEHIRQLGTVIREYQSWILVVQGLLVGSWGEMHDSKYLTKKWLIRLAEEMLKATDRQCHLAVRKPAQLRCIEEALGEKAKRNLTLFDDGIFGSETDLGTYESSPEARMRELSWMEENLSNGYIGGEVLAVQGMDEPVWIDGKRAEADFRKMHISYLNSVHQKKILDGWKKETMMWQEKQVSAYEYLGAHLGYRFVVRDVRFCRGVLKIRIENTGFANLCEDAICRLQIYAEHGKTERMIETDPKKWECRKENTLEIRLAKEEQRKGTRYLLQLFRKKDGRSIRFANQGAEDGVLLGNF